MKKWIFLFFVFIRIFSEAQDSTIQILKTEAIRKIPTIAADTIHKKWVRGGLFNLNIAQGSLKDWAAGGDDFSIAFNLYTNGHAFYKNGRSTWDNNVDIYLGYLNTTSLGTRKNDDRFDFLSKYGYALNSKFRLSSLFDLRTQFFDGYSYTNSVPTFSSTAFSPAYVLLSPGIDYHPLPMLSIFASPITSRWIVVVNPTLSKIGAYGVDSGSHYTNQLGAFATVMLNTNLNKMVTYSGRMDLFSNYEHNPQDVDMYMTNLLTAKISKVLSVTWDVDMIYDDDVKLFGKNHDSPRLQIKSMVGVGLLVKVGT